MLEVQTCKGAECPCCTDSGHDALKRLSMAFHDGNCLWLSFRYDGFGNKLSQTVTKGSAPASSTTVDANNRITGQSYDANGNMTSGASSTLTYDIDNCVVTAGGLSSENYSYDPGNKRIWKKRALGGGLFAEDVYFYGIGTGRLGIYTKSGGTYTVKSVDVRFAGKLIYTNSAWVATDRLGSIRYRKPSGAGERLDFFPYGEERPSATAQDRDKFATYMRDDTGLDYADQRYFTNTSGRFVTPDPAGDGSNWYAYAGGDPANSGDPTGLYATFDAFGPPFQGVVEPPQPVADPTYSYGGGFGQAFQGETGCPFGSHWNPVTLQCDPDRICQLLNNCNPFPPVETCPMEDPGCNGTNPPPLPIQLSCTLFAQSQPGGVFSNGSADGYSLQSPIYFNFIAYGGAGQYTFSHVQTFCHFSTYSNWNSSSVMQQTDCGTEQIAVTQNAGAVYQLYDAPGQRLGPADNPGYNLREITVTQQSLLTVTVHDAVGIWTSCSLSWSSFGYAVALVQGPLYGGFGFAKAN
jgi:RHS repeat-associated protein